MRCPLMVVPDLFTAARVCGVNLETVDQGMADERLRCPVCGATWSDGKSPDGAGEATG